MQIKITKEDDNQKWLVISSKAEREFSQNVLNDEKVHNIGEREFDYITGYVDDIEVCYCIYSENKIYSLYTKEEYQNKGYATQFIKEIINYYKTDIGFNSRHKEVEAIANKLGFVKTGVSFLSEYSNMYELEYIRKYN